MFAGGKHDFAEGDDVFFAERLADYGKGLLTDLAIRRDIIRIKQKTMALRGDFRSFRNF